MRSDTSSIIISVLLMGLGMSLTIVLYYIGKFIKFVKEDNAHRRLLREAAEREKLEEINKVIESMLEYRALNERHDHPNVFNISDYQRRGD